MSTIAIVLDDVIRKGADGVNDVGATLYKALCASNRVVVLCGPDKQRAEWFLATNEFTQHADLVAEDPQAYPTTGGKRLAQVASIRAEGSPVAMVIEPDPEIAAALLRNSVPVLVFVHPRFSHPSFLPDYENVAKPWNEMIAVLEYQEEQKAKQVWSGEEDLG